VERKKGFIFAAALRGR